MPHLPAILDQIPAALLVIFRIGGLMIYGPVFGSRVIPVRVKVFLSFVLGLAVFQVIDTEHLQQVPLELDLWSLAPMVAMELLIGMMIGFLASLPLVSLQIGGLIMGQQMGLGLARSFNPVMNDQANVVGQLLFLMALAGFVMIGGHEAMVLAVLNSFRHIPLGSFRVDPEFAAVVTGLLTASVEVALRVAAPLLALIFLQTVAMGFVAKTVPQLNILSLGFPLRILGGLLIITLGLVVINDVVMEMVDEVLQLIFELFG